VWTGITGSPYLAGFVILMVIGDVFDLLPDLGEYMPTSCPR
jgi:hypothetical protein